MDKGQNFYTRVKDLLPLLKKVFIDYYGKEYDKTITDTLDSIRFVITDSDGKFCKDAGDYSKVTGQDWSKLSAAYANGDIEKNGGCVVKDTFPPVIVLSDNEIIFLQYIFHEINHALHMERKGAGISSLMDMLGIKTKIGFSDKAHDYLYEIINEYMTFEIMSIARTYISDEYAESSGISMDFNKNCYLYLDDAINNYIYAMYNEDKDKIKKVLIKSEGNVYYEEFGDNNWDSISNNLKKFEGLFINYFWHADTLSKDEDTLYREAKEYLSEKLEILKKQIIMSFQNAGGSSSKKRK